jgi:hypothetical protein
LSLGFAVLAWESFPNPNRTYLVLQRRKEGSQLWDHVTTLPGEAKFYVDFNAPNSGRFYYRLVNGGPQGEEPGYESNPVSHPAFNGEGRDGAVRWDDVLYLLVPHDGRIRRFDLRAEAWLADLTPVVPERVQHFHVSDLGIFFSSNTTVYRLPLEGGDSEVVYQGGVSSLWTSGVRLHVSHGGTITSIALKGPEKGLPPIVSTTAVGPNSVSVSPDRRMVYGFIAGIGNLVMVHEEVSPGRFVLRSYRYPAGGAPTRATYLSAADVLVDDTGNRYRSRDVLGDGRANLGWRFMEETASGHVLLLQGSWLRSYDPNLGTLGSLRLRTEDVATASYSDRVWVFHVDASTPGFWEAMVVDGAELGLPSVDPGDPDPYFGLPLANVVDDRGTHWSIYSQQRQLVARTPGRLGTTARIELGGAPLAHAFDAARMRIAILLQTPAGDLEVGIFELSAGGREAARIPVDHRSHSLEWRDGELRVSGSDLTVSYTGNGVSSGQLPAVDQPVRSLHLVEADATATLSGAGGDMKLLVRNGTANRSYSFTKAPALRSTLLEASAPLDRLFSHPGGLRVLSDPDRSIHLNCIEPIAAAWSGRHLILLDRTGVGRSWLIAYDGITGEEIARRPTHGKGTLNATLGGMIDFAGLDSARKLRFTRFDARLNILTTGTGRAPNVSFDRATRSWIEGSPARIHALVDGDGPLTYEWLKNGEVIEGRHSFQLDFPTIAATDAGSYRLRVTNAHGTTSSQELTVTTGRADWGGRIGNLIEFSGTEILERTRTGNILSRTAVPEVIYDTDSAGFTMDATGRIHLAGYSELRKSFVYYIHHPVHGWSLVELASARVPYRGRAEARGHRVRFYDLLYDTSDDTLRRSPSTLIRAWGELDQTTVGLEDFSGKVVDGMIPASNELPNGWRVGSQYNLGGFVLFVNLLDARARKIRPDGWGRMELLGDDRLIVGRPLGPAISLDLKTFDYTYLSFDLPKPFRVVGGDAGVTARRSPFTSPESLHYLNAVGGTFDWIGPQYGDSIPFGGKSDWVTPNTYAPGIGATIWDSVFLPRNVMWKGKPESWNIAVREGESWVHPFSIARDASGAPFSRIEFSADLKTWSDKVPPGVEIDWGDDPYYDPPSIRITPSNAGRTMFFRFSPPANPFFEAEP